MANAGHTTPKPVDEIDAYFAEAEKAETLRDKSLLVAYMCLFIGHTIMLHRFYLNRWKSAIIVLSASYALVVADFLARAGVPFLADASPAGGDYMYAMLLGVGIMAVVSLVDMVILPLLVSEYNFEAKKRRVALGLEQ